MHDTVEGFPNSSSLQRLRLWLEDRLSRNAIDPAGDAPTGVGEERE
jgi:hypothetical protein